MQRYIRAWEEVDVTALVSLLKEDATFSMPPFPAWFRTREAIGTFFTSMIFAPINQWRLLSIHANSQPGFAAYRYDLATDCYQAHSIHVLALDSDGIISITGFVNPALFPYFGLQPNLGDKNNMPVS